MRSFLDYLAIHWLLQRLRRLCRFLQHGFFHLLRFAQRQLRLQHMASAKASQASTELSSASKRGLTILKTKEECRLGNETIQVWTVELPSKHAEGVLK